MSVTDEKEVIKMWSEKLKKDAWWVVDGDNYTGPFGKWCDAKRLTADDVVKPFDITKHELFKSGILTKYENSNNLYVSNSMWRLDKVRAIAIAKALGVTGEDLK